MKCLSNLLCKSSLLFTKSPSNSIGYFSNVVKTGLNSVQRDSFTFISRVKFSTSSATSDLFSFSFNPNVTKLTDFDQYHKVVYRPLETDTINMDDLVVSLFFNRQSTASLSVLESFNKVSALFPANQFLLVDSDLVPRSAYDADVQHFPSVLLSYGGDLYRNLVSGEPGFDKNWEKPYSWSFPKEEGGKLTENHHCSLPNMFYESVLNAMNKFSYYNGRKVSSIKSKAGTHSYTHGIDTDNLNLKRVGWPTE